MIECSNCGNLYDESLDHCPECLSSLHETDDNGDECGGIFEAVSVWIKDKGRPEIICRCAFCGALKTEPVEDSDNPITLMSVAARPIASPPFPIERISELTDLMGGQGDMDGYYRDHK
ncbi:MAG: RNHCP domain-containing protein [Lachnospiraceae bacterium]|nr:RNHCP domain-containing protein [Lachnospiraceae bacterium]